MPDHSPSVVDADERTTLNACLDYLRGCATAKLTDVDEEAAATAMVPSGTSLQWLALHLTAVEINLFQRVLGGRRSAQIVPGKPPPAEEDTVAAAVQRYLVACAGSRTLLDGWPDLGRPSLGRDLEGNQPTARWIVLHVIEETARHCGHLDILREQLDGSVGR